MSIERLREDIRIATSPEELKIYEILRALLDEHEKGINGDGAWFSKQSEAERLIQEYGDEP